MKALMIPVDPEEAPHIIEVEMDAALHSCRKIIGGWIEMIHRPGTVFLVDEDGRTKHLRINRNASWLVDQTLVGPVLGLGWSKGDWVDWPQWPHTVPRQ